MLYILYNIVISFKFIYKSYFSVVYLWHHHYHHTWWLWTNKRTHKYAHTHRHTWVSYNASRSMFWALTWSEPRALYVYIRTHVCMYVQAGVNVYVCYSYVCVYVLVPHLYIYVHTYNPWTIPIRVLLQQ